MRRVSCFWDWFIPFLRCINPKVLWILLDFKSFTVNDTPRNNNPTANLTNSYNIINADKYISFFCYVFFFRLLLRSFCLQLGDETISPLCTLSLHRDWWNHFFISFIFTTWQYRPLILILYTSSLVFCFVEIIQSPTIEKAHLFFRLNCLRYKLWVKQTQALIVEIYTRI